MTRKDYKAIAGAIYRAREAHYDGTDEAQPAIEALDTATANIAQALMVDNPLRFDRECFIVACETGKGVV